MPHYYTVTKCSTHRQSIFPKEILLFGFLLLGLSSGGQEEDGGGNGDEDGASKNDGFGRPGRAMDPGFESLSAYVHAQI